MNETRTTPAASQLIVQLIRLADDHLILGHRLSEWCGHAPLLEEDLALPNIALDLIGQARTLYTYAGELENKGRDEDDFAYRRFEVEYTNLLLCERPNGDFAHTLLRQLFFSLFMEHYWQAATESTDSHIAAIAAKAIKESRYHVRHSAQWVIRLGDGTEESAARTRLAMEQLTPYVAELFESDAITQSNASSGWLPDPSDVETAWCESLKPLLEQALLPFPAYQPGQSGGRRGVHTEDLGYLLAQLQYVQRSYPNMQW